MAVKTTTMGIKDHGQLTGLTTGDQHPHYQKESEKDAANGYAGLDASSKIAAAQAPYPHPVRVSDDLEASSDADVPTQETTYAKRKEFSALKVAGALRIKFALKNNSAYIAYGKIYRNREGAPTPVGTEQEQNGTGTNNTTEDIAGWEVGDIVELWSKISNAIGTCTVANFRLYGQVYVEMV